MHACAFSASGFRTRNIAFLATEFDGTDNSANKSIEVRPKDYIFRDIRSLRAIIYKVKSVLVYSKFKLTTRLYVVIKFAKIKYDNLLILGASKDCP